jgi:hypothetical protein
MPWKRTGYVNTLFQREFVITVIFQQTPDVYNALFSTSLSCNSVLQAVSWKADGYKAGAGIPGLNIHYHIYESRHRVPYLINSVYIALLYF